jgi:hypothetical protein
MKQLPGYEDKHVLDLVCKLDKAIYVLKQPQGRGTLNSILSYKCWASFLPREIHHYSFIPQVHHYVCPCVH